MIASFKNWIENAAALLLDRYTVRNLHPYAPSRGL